MKHNDNLFSTIALQYMGGIAGIVFVIGLISAAYPSAHGALTALTTSFCFYILSIQKNTKLNERSKTLIRYAVHISFSLLLLLVIVIFKQVNDDAVVLKLFKVAGYTYGPLLGLYAFGFLLPALYLINGFL